MILFVGFLFGERIWFGTKLNNFVGDSVQADRISRIITSIIHRVNYYLLVKTMISAITGAMVYVLAKMFGLELATALGVITFVLNFIPNVGSIIATTLITLVAHVQAGDARMTAIIFVIAGSIQFLNGNIIDPLLMGRALRLSAFGIILSLAFWGGCLGNPWHVPIGAHYGDAFSSVQPRFSPTPSRNFLVTRGATRKQKNAGSLDAKRHVQLGFRCARKQHRDQQLTGSCNQNRCAGHTAHIFKHTCKSDPRKRGSKARCESVTALYRGPTRASQQSPKKSVMPVAP